MTPSLPKLSTEKSKWKWDISFDELRGEGDIAKAVGLESGEK